jgi:hypothetical protein
MPIGGGTEYKNLCNQIIKVYDLVQSIVDEIESACRALEKHHELELKDVDHHLASLGTAIYVIRTGRCLALKNNFTAEAAHIVLRDGIIIEHAYISAGMEAYDTGDESAKALEAGLEYALKSPVHGTSFCSFRSNEVVKVRMRLTTCARCRCWFKALLRRFV